jgi:hypothetical protein
MGIYGVIDFDEEEIEAAGHWYGGQGSMLYAITSTGSLRRGTIRPRHDDGTPMTDDEWIVDLAERLESEAEEAARDAKKQAKKAKGAEKKELLADADGLSSIAFKANAFVRDAARATKAAHAAKKTPAQLDREIGQVLRAEARYGDYSTNELRREIKSLEDDFKMAGGWGVGLAERLDAARVALSLRGVKPSGARKKIGHAVKRPAATGTRIARKKLGEMMSPWGGDFAYGQGTGAIGAVSSYYYSDKKYPDRKWVERALQAIEEDIPKAEHGAHGWTKSDAKDLRKIASGLRYYLLHDYKE